MKSLIFGILILVVAGIGGLMYRNAVEHPNKKVACPVDAKLCPDGTSLSRVGPACSFPACAPPNVSLDRLQIAYAVPQGFSAKVSANDPSVVAEYDLQSASSTNTATAAILIRQYTMDASSTPLATIAATAVGIPSGAPVSSNAFTSTVIGFRRYTVVTIERFGGTIDTAYYHSRGTDVLRFDAVDRGVSNWTDANLDVSSLPAQTALLHLLSTLQGN